MNERLIKKIVHWALFVLIIFYVITGFGIEYSIIGPLTFGVLGKNLSFQIHNDLWIPFLILLILHIVITYKPKLWR